MSEETLTIHSLYETILDRKRNPKPGSYTSRLFAGNPDEIIKKVGEESVEVILASKGQGKQRTIEEIADLAYHLLVLMAQQEITPGDIQDELEKRRR